MTSPRWDRLAALGRRYLFYAVISALVGAGLSLLMNLDDSVDLSSWQVDDRAPFLADAYENVLDHGLRDPIFSAHLIKTIRAVEEESKIASTGCQRVLLASLNRFLNSPIKQKHTRRIARQSIDLVKRDFA